MTHAEGPSYTEMRKAEQAERKAQQDKDTESMKRVAAKEECRRSSLDNSTTNDHRGHGCSFDPEPFEAAARKRAEDDGVTYEVTDNRIPEQHTIVGLGGKQEVGKAGSASQGVSPGNTFYDISQQTYANVPHRYEFISGTNYCRWCGGAQFAAIHQGKAHGTVIMEVDDNEYDAVEPPHYKRGPEIKVDITSVISQGAHSVQRVVNCIEVMRHIKDPRLATAFKYVWRVAFGGKREPGETRSQREIDVRDIESAIWYLQDWIDNPT